VTAGNGQPQPRDRRTPAWLLSPADGNADRPARRIRNVAEARARSLFRRMLKPVAGAGGPLACAPVRNRRRDRQRRRGCFGACKNRGIWLAQAPLTHLGEHVERRLLS
jgi:hypothetical protein